MNTPDYTKSTPWRRRMPVLMGIIGVLSCILAVAALIGYFFLTPTDVAARPLVLIHAPLNGDQLEVGQTTTIHATARDENNITRLELWVNGELVQVETSSLPGGISPFPILANWQPTSAGAHTLTVRAFNNQGTRAHGSITIEAVELPDRDDDGIADEVDACPDEASPTPDGCPLSDDRDNDGVADAEDACPDEAGWADHDGCPTPGDSDGDGVLDEEDACPEERGLPDVEGCPDRDGDSVPDSMDADPDEPGPVESDGAPAPEGDDAHGLPPAAPGVPEGGDPGLDIPDSDGDGASDDVDPCPDEAGAPEDGFCPPPEDDPPPADDGPIFEFPGGFFEERVIPLNVEIEAYEFSVSSEFDNVWCYVRLADEEMQRYEFEPEGERHWNIRDVLGGANSVHLVAILGEPLPVYIDCGGDNIYLSDDDDDGSIGDGGAWGTVYDLGTHIAEHSSLEWDGRELIAAGIGPDGESFLARYRICSPTCDETALQPPILDPITLGPRGEGPYNIRWRWDGNEEWIDGFGMLVNGTLYDIVSSIAPDRRSLDIGEFRPECGEVFEFQIFAYGGNSTDGTYRESPLSNTQVWDGRTCPRTVLVTFLSLDTSSLGSRQGPISGTFYANDVSLIAEYRDGPPSFNATDDTEHYLAPGQFYDIADLFADIEREARSCIGSGCTSNYAPSVNSLQVELGPREALTFGANIWKAGGGRAFEGSAYIPAGEIVPGEYVVYDNGINMTVLVDVLVGPEAGGAEHLPDLIITDVTAEETSGQLRIHVFNNASDLVDENITINLVRMSTNEQIALHTWENVTIPSGRSMILQSGTLILEPYDLRVIVDPDNAIRETDVSNNIYETPVSMHVEFTRLGWGDPCENFLDQEAEYRFRLWVGHRAPGGEVNWIAQRNQPWSGTMDVDTSDWEHWEYDEEDWILEGNSWFSFDFAMPADHSLVLMADGYEDDAGLAADDYAGRVFIEYNRDVNYGNSPDSYHYESTDYICTDTTPLSWTTNNFHIWWRVNRIH